MMLTGSNFIIRPVEDNEHDAVLAVYRQCEDFLAICPVKTASMEMVRDDLAHSVKQGGRFCGIYDQQSGEMLGVVDYVRAGYEDDPAAAYLELLMIAAPYRSRGLGAEVVRLVEQDICQNAQVKVIRTGTQTDNFGAVRFWQRMGYQIAAGPKLLFEGISCYDLLKKLP